MLKRITLENFKPFGKAQTAELKPITLVYGPNSSGKSSLIQSLLLLEQSLRPSASGNLVPRGELVDLGSFQSLIHGHEPDRYLGLEVSFTASGYFGFSGAPSKFAHRGDELTVGLTYARGELQSVGSYLPASLREVSYRLDKSIGTIRFARTQEQNQFESSSESMYLIDENAVFFKLLDDESVKAAAKFIRDLDPSIEKQVSGSRQGDRIESWKSQLEFIQEQLEDRKEKISALRKKIDSPSLRPATIKTHKQGLAKFKKEKDHLNNIAKELQYRIKFQSERLGKGTRNKEAQSKEKTLEELLAESVLVSGFLPLPERVILSESDKSSRSELMHRRSFDMFSMNLFHELRSLRYLGPLRSYPARHYLVSGAGVQSVGKTGENTPHLLYEHKEKIRKDVNRWLDQFAIPYELDIDLKGDDEVMGDILTVSLRDIRTDIRVSPSDVGFGIGQLLPIIVEGLFSQENMLCVEQPEIHLHPKLQASLADFFIETSSNLRKSPSGGSDKKGRRSRSGEDVPQSNQWIVETHSEALILRLQKRIREGVISADDVSVLYVEPAKNGGRIINLTLDARGNFEKEWPDGFFEEAFEEMIG